MTEPNALPLKANLDDMPWESTGSQGKYGSDDKIVAHHVRQAQLDLAITRLMPGQASCPYHYHHVGEELFVVLEGGGYVRLGGETHRLRPHDVVSCPVGPEGAHQFVNDTDAPLVYMAISTEPDAEVCEYPDSAKVLSIVRRNGKRLHRHITRLADAVDYMDGEPT